jgi:hypothetical protein
MDHVNRLLRVPIVLVFAVLWGLGCYALGFVLLDERLSIALGAAFVGGVVVTATLGAFTGRPWPILAGLPLAIGALTTSVYLAGIHHFEQRPRLSVIVAEQHCSHDHYDFDAGRRVCDTHAYTFTDPDGRPVSYGLSRRDQQGDVHSAGETVEVYRAGADEIRWWPAAYVDPKDGVATAARIVVPLFVVYVLALGVGGAVSRVATRRRVQRHPAS